MTTPTSQLNPSPVPLTGQYDPNEIDNLKKFLASIKSARDEVHKVVITEGDEAANTKYCTNQYYVGPLHFRAYSMKATLEFLGVLDANCKSKISLMP